MTKKFTLYASTHTEDVFGKFIDTFYTVVDAREYIKTWLSVGTWWQIINNETNEVINQGYKLRDTFYG